MDKRILALLCLSLAVLLESTIIAFPYLDAALGSNQYNAGPAQPFSFPSSVFNQPISNDTDNALKPSYNGSWEATIQSSLTPSSPTATSEAQIALAPQFKTENLSIPTIIVQERADGLLRIEYYAQDWNNTFGLVLCNSTFPSLLSGENITLRFISFGPPSAVNPQLAPRPNGNLTIEVGSVVVLSNYPIAWATLAHIYLYGLSGSAFTNGDMGVTFRALTRG